MVILSIVKGGFTFGSGLKPGLSGDLGAGHQSPGPVKMCLWCENGQNLLSILLCSLCLSRACLGKCVRLLRYNRLPSYKMMMKWLFFSYLIPPFVGSVVREYSLSMKRVTPFQRASGPTVSPCHLNCA